MKTKIKFYNGAIKTDLHDYRKPKDVFHCIFHSIIIIIIIIILLLLLLSSSSSLLLLSLLLSIVSD